MDTLFVKTCSDLTCEFLKIVDIDDETNETIRAHLTDLLVKYFLPFVSNGSRPKIGLKKEVVASMAGGKLPVVTKPATASKVPSRPLNGYNLYVKVAKYVNTHTADVAPLKLSMPDYAAQWATLSSEQHEQFNTIVKSHPVISSDDDDLTELSEDELNVLSNNVTLFKKPKTSGAPAYDYQLFTKVRAAMKKAGVVHETKWVDMSEAARNSFFSENEQYLPVEQ